MDTTIKATLDQAATTEPGDGADAAHAAGGRPGSAHVITSDAEAIAVATRVAAELAVEAGVRDRERRLPVAELDLYSESGLWGITVPRQWGGAEVTVATLAEVFKIIAAADPSIAQMPRNHFHTLEVLRLTGTPDQQRFFFGHVLAGKRIGHAASERGSANVLQIATRLTRSGDGLVLNGQKFYTTGALFAHWIAVTAIDDEDRFVQAIVDRHSPGLTIIDDWSGFGQRTSASGTVILDAVPVNPDYVMSYQDAFKKPSMAGPASQLMHAAMDAGIARAAIDEAIDFVSTKTRPWPDSGVKRATDDLYIISAIGDLKIRLFAAECVLQRVAERLDSAVGELTEDDVALASVEVAAAKVVTTELAILATNKMLELAGTRATLAEYNLDRHWRNARTHTLHDPVRWKYHAVGNYYLNFVNPQRHAYI